MRALAILLVSSIAMEAPAFAVILSIPPARSRPVSEKDPDWPQIIPTEGEIAGQEDCDRPMLRSQTRSVDGQYIYQQVCRWATSDDIIEVRLSDGRRREVIPGNSLTVIRSGRWRGFLLIEQHFRPFKRGVPGDATWVVRPDGRNMFAIAGSDESKNGSDPHAVARWLTKQHAIAN
jgi:hypothetical protein